MRPARIVPNLLVDDGDAAIAFYRSAFGATEIARFRAPDGSLFAALDIGGARIHVGDESPSRRAFGPHALGGSCVPIDLLVGDPAMLYARAIAAGAVVEAPMGDGSDGVPLGRLRDPFGHVWIIGINPEAVIPETDDGAITARHHRHPDA